MVEGRDVRAVPFQLVEREALAKGHRLLADRADSALGVEAAKEVFVVRLLPVLELRSGFLVVGDDHSNTSNAFAIQRLMNHSLTPSNSSTCSHFQHSTINR